MASLLMIQSANTAIQVDHAMDNSVPPGENVSICAEFAAGVPPNTAARLTPICANLARVRSRAQRALGSRGLRSEIANVYAQALGVNDLFDSWARSVPSEWHWHPAQHFKIPPGLPRALFVYEDRIDLYCDIHVVAVWNVYRASRLRVLQIILDCIAALGEGSSGPLHGRRVTSINQVQELTDDICGTVPLILGTRMNLHTHFTSDVEYPYSNSQRVTQDHRRVATAIGGWTLVEPHNQPLKTAANMPYLGSGQKDWLFGQLARIMKLYKFSVDGPYNPTGTDNSTITSGLNPTLESEYQ